MVLKTNKDNEPKNGLIIGFLFDLEPMVKLVTSYLIYLK